MCRSEDTVNELHERAPKVAPLVIGTDRQPRQHVSATSLCPYRPLNVRLALVSVFIFVSGECGQYGNVLLHV